LFALISTTESPKKPPEGGSQISNLKSEICNPNAVNSKSELR